MPNNNNNNNQDGVSPRLISPRISGSITRRSFSNLNPSNCSSPNGPHHHEIDLVSSTPRSEDSFSADGFDAMIEKRQTRLGNLTQRVHLKKKMGSFGENLKDLGLELKVDKKRWGHWMFCTLCVGCVFLKISATTWFASRFDRIGFHHHQDIYDSSINHVTEHHSHDYRDGNVDKTMIMAASGVVESHNSMADHSELWSKPNSWNFTQCVDRSKGHIKPDSYTNGYILINANGGLTR